MDTVAAANRSSGEWRADLPSVSVAGRVLAYLAMVGLPVIGIFLVLGRGASLTAPFSRSTTATGLPSIAARDIVLRLDTFLVQILIILALAQVVGLALRKIDQPPVIGEMLAGILLGPSVLGAVSPTAYALLFPIGSVRFLASVSQLGLVMFMFLVGLELRPNELRGRGYAAILVSHSSIALPLFLGVLVSLLLYPAIGTNDVGFRAFALFVGAAMSVTAFPVLARLLADRKLTGTRLGALAVACAAVDDVSAWCILAIVVAIARPGVGTSNIWLTLAGSAAFVAAMFVVVRPRLAWLAGRYSTEGRISRELLAAIVMVMLAAAWVTQTLGIHALFGAFVAGVVMPKSPNFVRDAARPFEDVMLVVLLPLFFATTGIRMSLDIFEGAAMWGFFGLVLLVAFAGKLGGSAVASRVAGLSWRESLSLGALMNTRGLMGLIILSVGVDAGVVSQPLFVMMVLMSIITTMATAPLLSAFGLSSRVRSTGP
ncbi:MAG TPA: cation:proton antiporter [Gemmatimonadaceae bacterium]|nr:cation:proton antiporter [Gemmatimonadaceae bacterium]